MSDTDSQDEVFSGEEINPTDKSKWVVETVQKPFPAEKVNVKETVVTHVRASWDFDARNEAELSFKRGDDILITIQADGGWWQGKIGDKEGKIPINRVLVTEILHKKKTHLRVDQKKVTNRIRHLQSLVSRENLKADITTAPPTPTPTSSPLADKSPISTRRRRTISQKLSQKIVSPTRSDQPDTTQNTVLPSPEQRMLDERREKRRQDRERRQRIIEMQEAEAKRLAEEATVTESSEDSESSSETSTEEETSTEGSTSQEETESGTSEESSSQETAEEERSSNLSSSGADLLSQQSSVDTLESGLTDESASAEDSEEGTSSEEESECSSGETESTE